MKIDGVLLQLTEAREHLDRVIQELRDGTMGAGDDGGLMVDIDHLLDHICMAWNARDVSVPEYTELTHEDFERYWHTVPKLLSPRVLES